MLSTKLSWAVQSLLAILCWALVLKHGTTEGRPQIPVPRPRDEADSSPIVFMPEMALEPSLETSARHTGHRDPPPTPANADNNGRDLSDWKDMDVSDPDEEVFPFHNKLRFGSQSTAGEPSSTASQRTPVDPRPRVRYPPRKSLETHPKLSDAPAVLGKDGDSEELADFTDVAEEDLEVDMPGGEEPLGFQYQAPDEEEAEDLGDPVARELELWKEVSIAELVQDWQPNPFRDDPEEEEEEGSGVPRELAVSVIQAMNHEPDWRKEQREAGRDAASAVDVVPSGGSRIIALIFQSIGGPESSKSETGNEEEANQEDGEASLWDILDIFPFPILGNAFVATDYYFEYEENDDYDDVYNDEYDDEYDEDEYDDNYDDEDEDEDEDTGNIRLPDNKLKQSVDESDEDGDYIDCDDKDCTNNKEDEFTVFPLPPMVTKK